MQAAAGLISIVIKFSACVQRRKNKSFRTDSLFVHPHGNTAPVIRDRSGTVRLQNHFYSVAESGQMLVHGVVHDLIDQVV